MDLPPLFDRVSPVPPISPISPSPKLNLMRKRNPYQEEDIPVSVNIKMTIYILSAIESWKPSDFRLNLSLKHRIESGEKLPYLNRETFGWFPTFQEAETNVIYNALDFYDGTNDFALIEGIPSGLYQKPRFYWYKFDETKGIYKACKNKIEEETGIKNFMKLFPPIIG